MKVKKLFKSIEYYRSRLNDGVYIMVVNKNSCFINSMGSNHVVSVTLTMNYEDIAEAEEKIQKSEVPEEVLTRFNKHL